MSVWSKIYERINWKDLPQRLTALAARNLNKMDLAVDTLDDRTINLNTRLEAIEENPIDVDDHLDSDSENPVQNKVICAAFEDMLPEETAEGNPISISDGSNVVPAKLAEVTFLPKQDLHGYDSPWVGGAGKNKVNAEIKEQTTGSGIIGECFADNRFVFSGTSTGNGDFVTNCTPITIPSGTTYTISITGDLTLSSNALYLYYGGKNTNFTASTKARTITATEDITISTLRFRCFAGTTVSADFKLQIEIGSTATDYAPYSNICPITGRNSVKVKRTGKNLMSPLVKGVGLVAGTGVEQVSATSATTDYIPIKFTEDVPYYYISGLSNQISSFINAYNKDKQSLGRTIGNARTGLMLDKNFQSAGGTPQGTGDIAYIRITQYVLSGYTETIDVVDTLTPQVEIGQTATPYEAYNAQTYTESLGSTYYGGKVDFVSGEVVIDKAYKVFNGGSGESWSTAQNAFYIDTAFTDASSNFETNGNTCVCNMYAEENAVSTSSQVSSRSDFSFFNQKGTYYYRLWVKNSNYASVDAFKTALASQNLQIVYPLGTPITLTLTAQQIDLLKGANVLWTDGESIKLVYSADIKAWVENQLSV